VSKARDRTREKSAYRRASGRAAPGSVRSIIDRQKRVIENLREINGLRSKIRNMEEEIVKLRGRLNATPQEYQSLGSRLRQSSQRL